MTGLFGVPSTANCSDHRLLDVLRKRNDHSKIYGRETNLKSLQDAFDRISTQDSPSELVLVHGPSGCGKSSMVRALTDWIKTDRTELKVYCGSGKYDQLVNNEPYAAIVSASNYLCKCVEQGGPDTIGLFQKKLDHLIGQGAEEEAILCNAIPCMSRIVRDVNGSDEQVGTLSKAFTRFKQLWRLFLQTLSSTADITVLFLDDVQWADSNSLDLIHSLTESVSKKILLICAYRDDATVQKTQAASLEWCFSSAKKNRRNYNNNSKRSLFEANDTDTMPCTDIHLNNFDRDAVHDLVSGLLYGSNGPPHSEEGKIKELSGIMHEHTGGNPFFILYYLDYLSANNLLQRTNDGTMWHFDTFQIDHCDNIPETIGDLMSQIISRLPQKVLQILVIAAHVGHQFSFKLLQEEAIMRVFDMAEQAPPQDILTVQAPSRGRRASCNALYRDHTMSTLNAAVREGILEKKSKILYGFPHDQIQKSLHDVLLSSPNKQQLLHLQIGRSLLASSEQTRSGSDTSSAHSSGALSTELDLSDFFLAIDNLNKGSSLLEDPHERHSLSELNYEAAQMAMRKSAYEGAVRYIRESIHLLPGDRWLTIYEYTLDVYSLAARLEHCNGNFKRCDQLLDEIHANGRSLFDRLPAFFTQIDVLGMQGLLKEARLIGVMVLRQLGEPFPKTANFLHVLRELSHASRLIKKQKKIGFDKMSRSADPAKIAAMSVLSSLAKCAFVEGSKQKFNFSLSALRIVTISCRYGLSEHTPYGLHAYGGVQILLGNYKEAYDASMIAFNLVETIEGAQPLWARNGVFGHALIHPWNGHRLEELRPLYLRCARTGVAHGDGDYAYLSAVDYCVTGYLCGFPLKEVNDEVVKYVKEMNEFQAHFPKWFVVATWKSIRILLGLRAEDDEYVYEQQSYPSQPEVPNDPEYEIVELMTVRYTKEAVTVVTAFFDVLSSIILGTFGHSSHHESLLQDIHRNIGVIPMHFLTAYYWFAYGLGNFVLLRQTGKRKFLRRGSLALSELRLRFDKGGTFAEALVSLLEAESKAHKSSKNNNNSTVKAFLEAATIAAGESRSPFIEGYAYERLADIVGERSQQEADELAEKVTKVYEKWGATAKLDRLKQRIKSAPDNQ